ncbi:fluoride efflux transporter CrcB [Rhodohalobacter mucosus]|uniref:Fluoride-specific ion channel FluC n=1 Tax=Rhodohalobacter mucosus TaxID=2079485 RepID=A0A316TPD3_9BACT|nr:fluoride efflux transporter CrcB [Rhodohalobacter mucosus]PWN05531.1 fluoride efflux transporter CrcB [Rhodohalobacter mucosus]
MSQIIFVAAGGAAGAVCRYLITILISRLSGHSPVYTGTVAVNLSGSFAMGIIFGYLLQNPVIPETVVLTFSTGFLGSFTTFSTFALEVQNLLQKPLKDMLTYLILQLAAALLLAAAGMMAGITAAGGSIG